MLQSIICDPSPFVTNRRMQLPLGRVFRRQQVMVACMSRNSVAQRFAATDLKAQEPSHETPEMPEPPMDPEHQSPEADEPPLRRPFPTEDMPRPPTTPLGQTEMPLPPYGWGSWPAAPEMPYPGGSKNGEPGQQACPPHLSFASWSGHQTSAMGVTLAMGRIYPEPPRPPSPHPSIPLHGQELPPETPAPDVVSIPISNPRHPPGPDYIPPPHMPPDIEPPHVRPGTFPDIPSGPDMVPPGPDVPDIPPTPADTPPGFPPGDLPGGGDILPGMPGVPEYPAGDVSFPGGTEGAPAPAM